MGKYNDFKNDHAVVGVSGASFAEGVKLSGVLDTKAMEQAVCILQTGTIEATGTLDVKIEHSPDNSTWADLTGAAFAQKVAADDDTIYYGIIKCNQVGVDRYLRISATPATADADYGCLLIGKNLSGHMPFTVNALPTPEWDILPPT